MNDQCVIWDRESNRLEMATMDALINFNLAALLEDKPGRVLLRTSLTEEQAKRFIKAYAGFMARRSLERIGEWPKK